VANAILALAIYTVFLFMFHSALSFSARNTKVLMTYSTDSVHIRQDVCHCGCPAWLLSGVSYSSCLCSSHQSPRAWARSV